HPQLASPACGLRPAAASRRLRAGHRPLRVGLCGPASDTATPTGDRARRFPHRLVRRRDTRRRRARAAGHHRRRSRSGGAGHVRSGGCLSAGRRARSRPLVGARRAVAGGRGGAVGLDGPDPRGRRPRSRRARHGAPPRPAARRGAVSPLARWRTAAFAGGAVSAILTLAAAHAAATRAARTFAERSAVTVAGCLALVTPVAKGRSGYELPQLPFQAAALATLPGWTPQVEVYHGTAPLVHGTAAPLTPADVERLRRDEAIAWVRGAAVAPLFDPDGWGVVGAVSVRAPHLGPRWFGWWGLAVLALALALAGAAARAIGVESSAPAKACLRYRAAALLLGIAAYADARAAARRAIDRWLADTRALVQEAAATPERPALADLAGLLGRGELVPGDSGSAAPRRRSVGGVFLASVPVRLGPGRWAELRVPVGDASGYALL